MEDRGPHVHLLVYDFGPALFPWGVQQLPVALAAHPQQGKVPGQHGPAVVLQHRRGLRHEMGRHHGGLLRHHLPAFDFVPHRPALDHQRHHQRRRRKGMRYRQHSILEFRRIAK